MHVIVRGLVPLRWRRPKRLTAFSVGAGVWGTTRKSSGIREFDFETARQGRNGTAERDSLFLFFSGGLKRAAEPAVIVIES